jgi:predicted GNAT family acetyltransferase
VTITAGAKADVRLLGARDLAAVAKLVGARPVENVFVDYRCRITQLDPRWLGGEVWGYFTDGELTSMLHVGANVTPVESTPAAAVAFAQRLRNKPATSMALVGSQHMVAPMWELLRQTWPEPRLERWEQPHYTISRVPEVAADPAVRLTRSAEFEAIYPACVAMHTEELGASPERDGGRPAYRARVRQLISSGWSFSRIEQGRVIFKAEVACATQDACQVQGVYVDPAYRGRGLAAAGMAAVVRLCLDRIAPNVGLFANAHNEPALRAYERVGFERTDTFASILY